jgi:SAM-dependent methyltransferase
LKDNFVHIEFTTDTLDVYHIRRSILAALHDLLVDGKGSLLDIGCGKMPYKKFILDNSEVTEYVGLDIENALIYDANIKPDFTWDGVKMPFEDSRFEIAIATEVLEHCPYPEVVLKEVQRVLKPGGVFFFTVPFLWNLHEVPNDQYRYTPFALERYLKTSGFTDIDVKAMGGWHAALAQILGLWVRRSPMSQNKRKYLSKILKPIIAYLIKKDAKHAIEFKNGQMITGLSGTAKK